MAEVTVTVEVASEDLKRIQDAVGEKDVERLLNVIAQAGAREGLEQACGRHSFSNITDLRAFRIYCLLQEGLRLCEAERLIASIFNVPVPTAKRMVRTAIARYHAELRGDVDAEVIAVLETATWDPERSRWVLRLQSSFVRDRIAQMLEADGLLMPQRSEQAGGWRFPEETLNALRRRLGLQPVQGNS